MCNIMWFTSVNYKLCLKKREEKRKRKDKMVYASREEKRKKVFTFGFICSATYFYANRNIVLVVLIIGFLRHKQLFVAIKLKGG